MKLATLLMMLLVMPGWAQDAKIPDSKEPPPPKLSAELLPGATAIAPGQTIPLLVRIEISAPWHIYHPILLDTGAPTEIKIDAPPGVRVENLRFPEPVLGATGPADFRIEYLEHEGAFDVVGELTIDGSVAAGQTIKLEAHVSALACVEACIPVEATAELSLPVRDGGGEPANVKALANAREALPAKLAEAEWIKGSTLVSSKSEVEINESFELVATLQIAAAHHIQDRDPGVEGLIATRLLIESRSGVEIAEEARQKWPEPHVREMPYIGKVREHSGKLEIRVPIRVTDPAFPDGPVSLRALIRYQACSDAGQCFPPSWAEADVQFRVKNPDATPDIAPVATRADGDSSDEPLARRRFGDEQTLVLALILGFLGGLLLNIMPCVLPVVSIKVLSFVQEAHEPGRLVKLGLAFSAGIMAWFWLFALLSMTGHLPLQYPGVVLGIATVLLLLALNLFGVFEITLPGAATSSLDKATTREGYSGAFFKGFLATILGTACTAPGLAGALLFAASQPWYVALAVFTSAGLGMALPYLLLTINPQWLKFVPKPGNWMIGFKQAMGFVLLGTVVWLMSVLGDQLGHTALAATAAFWCAVSFAVWMIGRLPYSATTVRRAGTWLTAGAVAVAGYAFSFHWWFNLSRALEGEEPDRVLVKNVVPESGADPATGTSLVNDKQLKSISSTAEIVARSVAADWSQGIPWIEHAPELPEQLAADGYTVYVDYTATWCAICLTNKATSLEIDSVRERMRAMGVIPIKADITKRTPWILAEIKSFGRPSVPLNVIFPAGRPDDPIVLPTVLTPGIVRNALDEAGPSNATAPSASG